MTTEVARKPAGHPENGAQTSLQTLETVKARLNARYGVCKRWETVAAEFGVSVGTAVRVAGGYEPQRTATRRALGLSALVLMPACPACGIAHVRACPKARKAARPSKAVRRRRLWHSGLWRAACRELARALRGPA